MRLATNEPASDVISSRSVGGFFAILGVASAALLIERSGTDEPTNVPAGLETGLDTLPLEAVPAEAVRLIEEGRTWRAARVLRGYVRSLSEPTPEATFVAAWTEAQWGGWDEALEYLEGRPWLDEVEGGEGWFWLARAQEETGSYGDALAAYNRYLVLQAPGEQSPRVATAELRRGLLLVRLDQRAAGTAALAAVRERAPYLTDWIGVLTAEALASTGDTTAVREVMQALPDSAEMRHRGRVAWIQAYEVADDPEGALQAARAARGAAAVGSHRAQYAQIAGRIALQLGDEEAARRELLAAVEAAPGSSAAREAANLMLRVSGLTAADRLAIADIYARHGNNARAADGYREWLDRGSGSTTQRNEVRLRLGRSLFVAGQLPAAEAALGPLHDAAPRIAREAMLLTGRSQYRRGSNQQAFATFEQLARRFPGSSEGSEGLHLVADLSHDAGELERAAGLYRRVAEEFWGTNRAGLSLMRLAGMRYVAQDFAGAAEIWLEYRSAYPNGQRWLESSYWAARSYEALGDTARARSLYQAVQERDPLSYYALRSSRRLGTPSWQIPMSSSPAEDPAAEARVADWMTTVDVLYEAGLHAEANAEAQRLADRAGADLSVLYPLAEALNERGYAVRGIQLGQRIQRYADGMNQRLLRILYPFPYRALVEAEAKEQGVDPFVVAALTRQESLFTARITSPAGARGLMQIMPETGEALARGTAIDDWDAELLYHPEVNVHLGIKYLAEQMRQYDESLPSVFSAYNAGPHRVEVWKDFPEYRDAELFTERIPYRETRDYVKILTRNIELYRGLYGDESDGS